MCCPTSSMSGVRKHFWHEVEARGSAASRRPRKYGLKGCIPAIVSSVEVSSGAGISDADGTPQVPALLEERQVGLADLGWSSRRT